MTRLLPFLLAVMATPAAQAQVPPDSAGAFSAPVQPYPARTVDIREIALDAAWTGEELRVVMQARIVATRRGTLQFSWPTHGLALDSVFVSPAGADTALSVIRGDSLIVSLDGPLDTVTETRVRVFYRALPGAGLEPPTGSCCLVTDRRWLPVPDDPGDRFRLPSLRLRLPETWVPAGPGEARRRDGAWEFRAPRPVHLQQVAVAAGEFRSDRRGTLRYLLAPNVSGDLDAFHRGVSRARQFAERQTGFRLSWDTLTVVLVPRASERQLPAGLILPAARLRDARSPGTVRDAFELAASVAGQWTHVALAPEWWAESWVSDGLAGVLALALLEDEGGADALVAAHFELMDAYLSEAYRRPLVWDRFEHGEDLRDAHARYKGPLVLMQAMERIGRPAFWADMRRLLARYSFASVDTGTLLEVLEPDGPGAVARLFDSLVFAAGHPEVAVTHVWNGDEQRTDVTLSQLQEGTLVPAEFALETTVEWLPFGAPQRMPIRVDERETEFALDSGFAPRYVTIDPSGLLLAEVQATTDVADVAARLRYGELAVRLRAARDLALVASDPAAGISLRLALAQETHPAVRTRLARSAARFPASASVRELLASLVEDPSPAVRIAALESLSALYPDGSADAILERLAQRDVVSDVQAAAVAHMRGPGAEDLARAALITPSAGDVIRTSGLRQLARLGALTPEDFLAHTEPSRPVAEILHTLPFASAVETTRPVRVRVLSLLTHDAPPVRAAAARAGATLLIDGNAPAVERLLRTEPHARVRAAMQELLTALQGAS